MRTSAALVGGMVVLFAMALPAWSVSSDAYVPAGDWADHPAGRAESDSYIPRTEFSLGAGYSRINFSGSPPLIDGRDCVHLEPVVNCVPFAEVPQLRLGAGFGWSAAVDDTRGALISRDGGAVWAGTSDVTFMMFEPEARLSWRQPFGPDGFYFIEPGVSAGAAIGWLDVAGSAAAGSGINGKFSETDASFMWKVFLRAGIPFSNGLAGIEASYLSASRLDFTDEIRGKPNEFYFGIFGSLQF